MQSALRPWCPCRDNCAVVHKDKQLVDKALQLGVTAVGYIGTQLLLRTSNCSNGSAGFAVLLVCSISAALFLV